MSLLSNDLTDFVKIRLVATRVGDIWGQMN